MQQQQTTLNEVGGKLDHILVHFQQCAATSQQALMDSQQAMAFSQQAAACGQYLVARVQHQEEENAGLHDEQQEQAKSIMDIHKRIAVLENERDNRKQLEYNNGRPIGGILVEPGAVQQSFMDTGTNSLLCTPQTGSKRKHSAPGIEERNVTSKRPDRALSPASTPAIPMQWFPQPASTPAIPIVQSSSPQSSYPPPAFAPSNPTMQSLFPPPPPLAPPNPTMQSMFPPPAPPASVPSS